MTKCSECDSELETETVTREYLEAFCPNEDCTEFVRLFWIER